MFLHDTALRSGGRIIITNFASNNPYRPWMEYFADWRLIERDEDDIPACLIDSGLQEGQFTFERNLTNLTILTKVQRT